MTSKIEILSFVTKVNPNNGNETKSDIFSSDIFKPDTTSISIKNIKVFQWLSKSTFFSFLTKMNPNNGNYLKSDISTWENTKIFQRLIKFVLFNFIAKVSTIKVKVNKITWNIGKSDSIFP